MKYKMKRSTKFVGNILLVTITLFFIQIIQLLDNFIRSFVFEENVLAFRPIPALIGLSLASYYFHKSTKYQPLYFEIKDNKLFIKSLFISKSIPFSKIKFVEKSKDIRHYPILSYSSQFYYKQSYFVTYYDDKDVKRELRIMWHCYNGDFKAFESEMIRAMNLD